MDLHFLKLVSQIETRTKSSYSLIKAPVVSKNKNHVNVDLSSISKNSSKVKNVYIKTPPRGLERAFYELLTHEAVEFLADLVIKFDEDINNLYNHRLQRKAEQRINPKIPSFFKLQVEDDDWKVAPVNNRLRNRHLDLGDVSPSNLDHFSAALCANVQGIQVDFDDGHCPNWFNQIYGLHNVFKAVHNQLDNVPEISTAPILMLRPRAWNMIEKNVHINGKYIPGPLFDFALLMFHTGKILYKCGCGPCFYLSKLESSDEAKLWNNIFSWSEERLGIPYGSIKACVLIENILASFEVESILYQLKDHSLGLNCGIWDYAASIIAKFGDKKSFVLPDRNKYVNMDKRFLKKYLQLVIKVCHKRGAHATGGMAAQLLPPDSNSESYKIILQKICEAKMKEIQEGVDGFMVYDLNLVPFMNNLWKEFPKVPGLNQISYPGTPEEITEEDLLSLPEGGVTIKGLEHNIKVAILFIYNWFNGRGHFIVDESIEDSATAEISRSQIWQWIRHAAKLEDYHNNKNDTVTSQLVDILTEQIVNDLLKTYFTNLSLDRVRKLVMAKHVFIDIVNSRDFPDFITTYVYDVYPFNNLLSHL